MLHFTTKLGTDDVPSCNMYTARDMEIISKDTEDAPCVPDPKLVWGN